MYSSGSDRRAMATSWWRRPEVKRTAAIAGVVLLVLVALRISPFSLSPHDASGLKIYIIASAALVALFWVRLPQHVRLVLLTVLAVTASLNYYRWGPRSLYEKVDVYDVIHYYLGAKYYPELGYEGLYPALILVDHDNGPKTGQLKRYRAQTAAGYEFRPVEDALERGRELRETRFTEERWRSFEHDSLVLSRDIGISNASWRKLLLDLGFNGSPFWAALARPLVELVPVESVKYLCLLDPVLIGTGLLALWYAYGGVTALWALIFVAAAYSMRWPVAGEALLRYFWLASLLWALALVKMGRPALAGVATGLAALARIFPIVWLFGLGVLALHRLARRPFDLRNMDRFALFVGAGFASCVLAAAIWVALDVGMGSFADHAVEMGLHVGRLASRHIGLAVTFIFEGGLLPRHITPEQKEAVHELQTITRTVGVAYLAILGFGMGRLTRDQAFALGFLPFFMLVLAHDYHGVARVTLVVYHVSRLENRWDRICLAWLLALEVFAGWALVAYSDHVAFRIGYLAWGTAIYAVMVAAPLCWGWLAKGAGAAKGEGYN